VEVTRLSNGQLKKPLLLKILLAEIPRFLLLDYPFEGLNHGSRSDLCAFLKLYVGWII
jgi:molybdate transport system ATP-binding protein